MALTSSSLAAATGVSVRNTQFKAGAQVVPRKILIVGTYNPAITTITDNEPVQVLSPEDAGAKLGRGFMAHRLAEKVFAGSGGVETWISPQAEAGAAVAASGTIAFSGTASESGVVVVYTAFDRIATVVASGDAAADIADAVAAAINLLPDLPVTAAAATGTVTLTAKSKGPWGNDISLALNIGLGEALPAGVTATVTAMSSGAGIPDITDALNALGTGDGANEAHFTDVVHGYGTDATTLDAISAYVGPGNEDVGLYAKMVSRPFRAMTGDVVAGSGGYSAITAIGNGRKLDRANGAVSVPGSHSHPSEIAAQTIGVMARINNIRAEQSFVDLPLTGIDPGDKANRWTSEYDNRDGAVKAGVSPTFVKNGVVTLQNVVTFYHPDDVPVTSNGYRSMRNISILQNIMDNMRRNFAREKWSGISIVQDVARVTDPTNRLKARDVDAVKDDLVALAKSFEGHAWIYTADFTLDKLKEADAVVIRPGANGFENKLSIILSGEGGIIDTMVAFDTSIAILIA